MSIRLKEIIGILIVGVALVAGAALVAGVALSSAIVSVVLGLTVFLAGAVILIIWAVLGLPARRDVDDPKVAAANSQLVPPPAQKPHSEVLMDELRAERWAIEEQRRRPKTVEGDAEERNVLQAAGGQVGRREGRR